MCKEGVGLVGEWVSEWTVYICMQGEHANKQCFTSRTLGSINCKYKMFVKSLFPATNSCSRFKWSTEIAEIISSMTNSWKKSKQTIWCQIHVLSVWDSRNLDDMSYYCYIKVSPLPPNYRFRTFAFGSDLFSHFEPVSAYRLDFEWSWCLIWDCSSVSEFT